MIFIYYDLIDLIQNFTTFNHPSKNSVIFKKIFILISQSDKKFGVSIKLLTFEKTDQTQLLCDLFNSLKNMVINFQFFKNCCIGFGRMFKITKMIGMNLLNLIPIEYFSITEFNEVEGGFSLIFHIEINSKISNVGLQYNRHYTHNLS